MGTSRRMELTIKDLTGCMENIELWCGFVKRALASYDPSSKLSVLSEAPVMGPVLPPKIDGCPPPPDEGWTPKKPKKPKNPKARKKK